MRSLVANQPGTAGMKLATSWLASTAATAISVGTPDRGERARHADGADRGAAARDRDERGDGADDDVDREQRPVVEAAAERLEAAQHHGRVHQRVHRVADHQLGDAARRPQRVPDRGGRARELRHDHVAELRDEPDEAADDEEQRRSRRARDRRSPTSGSCRCGSTWATARARRRAAGCWRRCSRRWRAPRPTPPRTRGRSPASAGSGSARPSRRPRAPRGSRTTSTAGARSCARAAAGWARVPISDTAVATLVPNEMISATRQPPPVGARDRVPELGGITDLTQQREDRDQRADRHEQARGVDARELLQRRRLHAGRRARGVAHLAEQLLEVGSRATPVAAACRGSARAGLEERERLGDRVRSRAPRARPDRALGPDELREAHEQLGDVGAPMIGVDAAVASVKSTRTTPSAPSTTCCVFRRPCATCAACKRCTARQRSVEHVVGDARRVDDRRAVSLRPAARRAAPRPALPFPPPRPAARGTSARSARSRV